MICPFQQLVEKNPNEVRIRRCVICQSASDECICNFIDCLKCPFFPEELRQRLLTLEFEMIKKCHAKL